MRDFLFSFGPAICQLVVLVVLIIDYKIQSNKDARSGGNITKSKVSEVKNED